MTTRYIPEMPEYAGNIEIGSCSKYMHDESSRIRAWAHAGVAAICRIMQPPRQASFTPRAWDGPASHQFFTSQPRNFWR